MATIYNRVLPRYSYVDTLDFARDTTYRTYDASGNVEMGWKRSWRGSQVKVQTRSYWGAEGRLRAQEEYHETNGTSYLLHERRGYFSEYRYDALGRRVMVRSRRDGLCHKGNNVIADCTGGITRYVWSGDNLLWEMRGPGADSTFPGNLDDISDSRAEFGVVGYTHAGGVDRPLVVWKGIGSSPSVVVVPHMNWRGLFGRGTNSSGSATTVAVEWAGFQTTAYHAYGPNQESTTNWMGSLIEGQRDPGGGMYMRNRYYDPATGQFTQTDPIGIAGGLNTYGFANGDPVGNADAFGLCSTVIDKSTGKSVAAGPTVCKLPTITVTSKAPRPLWILGPRFHYLRNSDAYDSRRDREHYSPPEGSPQCLNAQPVAGSNRYPYSSDYFYMGVNANFMFEHGGNGAWGQDVRGCLLCMAREGRDPDAAHKFCYAAADSELPWFETVRGWTTAVGAASLYSIGSRTNPDFYRK